ncbi:AAA family ATPase [Streptomyces qinglanensis]|uniref:AAA family ATPase n=1 Tax=Streptomyces qinglanensis TaxID=943816 RepID=UPI00379A4B28
MGSPCRAGAVPRGARAGPAARAEVRHDLRRTAGPWTLRYPAGDVVVVSGLPGGGKSTLIRRAVPARSDAVRIDSQDARERWEARMPRWLPYGAYRPLVRLAHYAALRTALGSGAAVMVHDCGTQSWVRRWLARDAVRRGRSLHLLLLDVPAGDALAGQTARGRRVTGYAFRRHLRAVGGLRAVAEAGRLPRGCVSSVLLDREAAHGVRSVLFEPLPAAVPMVLSRWAGPPDPTGPPSLPPPGAERRPAAPAPARGAGAADGDIGDRAQGVTGISGPLPG